MKNNYVLDKGINRVEKTFFENNIPLAPKIKTHILEYLKCGEIYGYTTQPRYDYYTGNIVDSLNDNVYTDGIYTWNYMISYHLESCR